jgi:hypothetical protein
MYENLAPPPDINDLEELALGNTLNQPTKSFVVLTPDMEMKLRFHGMRQEALAYIALSATEEQAEEEERLLDDLAAEQVYLALQFQARAMKDGDDNWRPEDFIGASDDLAVSENVRVIRRRSLEMLARLSLESEADELMIAVPA